MRRAGDVGARLDDRGVVRRPRGPGTVVRRGTRVVVDGPPAARVLASVAPDAALAAGQPPQVREAQASDATAATTRSAARPSP